ncbi:6-phosphogluconolactonase, partial [Chlamydiales bacterium]|nr:6-phosphogluconolactonase [Chlamydiales bacterium]
IRAMSGTCMMYKVDERRNVYIGHDTKESILFAVDHLIDQAEEAISKRSGFYLALSGGSTPKAIFHTLATHPRKQSVDWSKVYLFWSDERCVPPTDSQSNYKMAIDFGINTLNIPESNIYRMKGELDPKEAASDYEKTIKEVVPHATFDLIMLGMGDDGHTASLFPDSEALHIKDHLVAANWVEKVSMWRLTFTFPLINQARETNLYVLGSLKKERVAKVFSSPESDNPVAQIGTEEHPALWILDQESANNLNSTIT